MKKKHKKWIKKILFFLAIATMVVFTLGPYLWMVSSSFKSDLEIQGMEPSWIPQTFTLDNYKAMNTTVPIFKYFKNSLIISLGTMVITIIIGTLAAYGISRYRFRGKNAYVLGLFSTQMLPGILFLIPFFVIFTWVKNTFGIPMANTYHGLIFTYTSFALPFSIVMLKSYLDSVPFEIDEQAMIDGCSRVQALYKVILPVSKPGIAAVAIYSFIMGWNEILFAMVLTSTKTKTISLGLLQYITKNQADWGAMMAACIITTIPVLILFTLMQKHIVQGLVAGATKG